MSDAMDKGREMHEAINWAEWDKHMAKRQLEYQAEDRMHRKGDPSVVYIDAEAADGKLRAALDVADGKQRIIVISDHHAAGELDDELKSLIDGTHPMLKNAKRINYGDIIKMPPKEFFIQEHMNVPPKKQ